jgi:hypothetical protein
MFAERESTSTEKNILKDEMGRIQTFLSRYWKLQRRKM